MGSTGGKDGAETSESEKTWMSSLPPGKDMSFKEYLEDIKRKHAYAEAMKAAKKRPPDEDIPEQADSNGIQEKKPRLTTDTSDKDTPSKEKAESDEDIEWEDNEDGIVWEDGPGSHEGDDGDGDSQYDEETMEAARIADMESDAKRASNGM